MASDRTRRLPASAATAVPLELNIAQAPLTAEHTPAVPPAAPVAPVKPHVDARHGDIRPDEYRWLRERDNPEVLAYLDAENEYTRQVMQHTERLQEQLFQEL